MELTPRTLALALGACVLGGLAFGVVTTFAPTSSTAAPETTSGSTSTSSASELGDQVSTMPSPSPGATLAPTPLASLTPTFVPTPIATTASSRPTSQPSAVVSATASPRATATPINRGSAKPKAKRPTSTQRPSTAPRPAPAAWPAARPAPRPRASAPAPKATRVMGGWRPASLQRGTNTLTLPVLNSGAKVRLVVGCSPSSACTISGDQLLIAGDVASVTVTWSAPAKDGHASWQVSRALG